MKHRIFALVVALLATACSARNTKSPTPPDTSMANMPGMAGVPGRAAASGADSNPIQIDRAAAARVGITFARATVGSPSTAIRLDGTITYPEPSRRIVTVRMNGWAEHVGADFVGKPVRAGDTLVVLYSPELVSAEQEYLSARRLGDSALANAARQRLALWELPSDVLAEVTRNGAPSRTFVVRSPSNGEVVEKNMVEGQAVHPGDMLFRIADRATVWIDATVDERDANTIRTGSPVTLSVITVPGRTWRGVVSFIEPTADSVSRTLTARIEVANPDRQLRPGAHATIEVGSTGARAVSVPLTAVLPTGRHNLVFVNRGDGQFVPREVQVGARNDSLIAVTSGLKVGDEVIASATYLLDSESNLAAALRGLMLQMGMGLDMGGMRKAAKGSVP